MSASGKNLAGLNRTDIDDITLASFRQDAAAVDLRTKPFARRRPMSKELPAKRENKEFAIQALHPHLSVVAIQRP